MQTIQVFEYGKLKVGEKYGDVEFQQRHLTVLSKYNGDRGEEKTFFTLINKGVRFKQFVGVICVGDLQIEVLPKADKVKNDEMAFWKNQLMDMLKVVYKLKVHSPSNCQDNTRPSEILDVFLQRFMDEAERLLHIGLVKTYRQKEENCNALKGKLLFAKNISQNCVHKERFYVRHTVYDYNHICNRIIAKVLKMIPDISGNSYTRHRANSILFEMPELMDTSVDAATFATMQYNRKTEDYRTAMDIARLILLHYMPKMNRENAHEQVLALMFDMNKLWEEYVYLTLRKQLTDYEVTAQEKRLFWTGKNGDANKSSYLKPDITIKSGKDCVAVLDTKWKIPKEKDSLVADLRQMFAYHHYWETTKTALLYPGNSKTVIGEFKKNASFICPYTTTKLNCAMMFLPIDDKNNWGKNITEQFNI